MRILSGMRPTGKLHIGHLVGALENWVKLQNEGNECFYFVADWHSLTTHYRETEHLKEHTRDMVRIFLAVGIDPEKSVIFVQSAIKEHAELALLFSMIVTVSRLERIPTYKEKKQDLNELPSAGLLIYPVLQSADILMYKAEGVPVGEDQVYHVELTREIARRFNSLYDEVFPEPEAILSHTPKLPGTDGRKMSKSYGNVIHIETDEETLERMIMPMMTDTARKRRSDPGNPENCPVWLYHKAFGISEDEAKWVWEGCTKAKIGCVECKRLLVRNMKKKLQPIWERLAEIDKDKHYVDDVIAEGNRRAREVASSTMEDVRKAMNLMF